MSTLAAEGPAPEILVPHWLAAADREQLAGVVRSALEDPAVHPVAAVRLSDVLTELSVAAARDAVWPAPAARVRRATGWGVDVLPVRLSAVELASVLALPTLSAALRTALSGPRP
ncbi:hypothetical protein [Geodermatophilus ruber]|uniref:Uncharacterized protein n=1 Tax=Geodermatophilus ruber TaxID=504800 RepID=A0A1I4G156_9ACTN|nr:hypothetical protein [Geodermatophilus ruber]SFL23443.1 hypothetical protein SAMN04488085_10887 [Geodermatophilus ruber]